MSYTLIVQQEALDELQDAYDYYESRQANLGRDFIIAFRVEALRIEKNPHLFQKIYNEKRRTVIRKFQYNIIYQIEGEEVRVSAVMHGSRDPKRWQNR
jgi:plasmid stabilization system protein ParE